MYNADLCYGPTGTGAPQRTHSTGGIVLNGSIQERVVVVVVRGDRHAPAQQG